MSKKKESSKGIRIVCKDSMMPHHSKVYLDGKDITHCIKKLNVKIDADKPNEVSLTIIPKDIDIDIEAIIKTKSGDKK